MSESFLFLSYTWSSHLQGVYSYFLDPALHHHLYQEWILPFFIQRIIPSSIKIEFFPFSKPALYPNICWEWTLTFLYPPLHLHIHWLTHSCILVFSSPHSSSFTPISRMWFSRQPRVILPSISWTWFLHKPSVVPSFQPKPWTTYQLLPSVVPSLTHFPYLTLSVCILRRANLPVWTFLCCGLIEDHKHQVVVTFLLF